MIPTVVAPYTPRLGRGIPDALKRGLVFAPDMVTAQDLVSEQIGTLDGSTQMGDLEARSFNGTTDRIDYANVRDFGTVRVPSSCACWIYPTAVDLLRTIWVDSASPSSQSVQLRTNLDAIEFTHATDAVPLRRISAVGGLTVNTWIHIAYTYNGGVLSTDAAIYINGVETAYQAGSNPTGVPRAGNGIWAIGGRVEADTNNFAGRIRQMMVWDRQLAAAEVAALAQLPRPV